MTANRTITELYQALRPLLLRDVAIAASGSRASSGGMETHALNSNWHTGQLAETQAPWAATKNEWATALATHAALPDVHHAAVTAGTLISLSGQQVGIAAGAAYQFIGTGSDTVPEWRNVNELAGNGLTHASGVLAVGVSGLGLSVAADAVSLASSSNPGAAASILASDASGYLTLVRLIASDRVRTPLLDTASGALTLDPAGDVVTLAASTSIQTAHYASQLTGWRATYAGEADFRYLFVDEMHVKSFVADLEQALAGGQIISKSVAVLSAAFTAPSAGDFTALYVRDLPSAPNMACFQAGDIVRLRQFSRAGGSLSIADCWGSVTDYADGNGSNFSEGFQFWKFTRSAAPNAGAMAAGTVIQPDALVLDYGVGGNGYYEVNAIDGAYGQNSPYARIATWTGHPATGTALRAQFGNLRGVYGYAATEFGVAMGSATGANVTVDATNGVRLRQGTTDMIVLDPAGNSYFAGVMAIGESGEIRQGTGTLGSNFTGLRMWRESSIGRIGGYNANALQWYAGTDGRLYAGGGAASVNQYGYMVATADFGSGGTWPFTFGGVHAVADVTAPTANYYGSLMFGQPLGVFTDVPRVWHFHYPGTLAANTPTGGGASKEYAITISDDNESWIVWHTGNDSELAKIAGATFTGALRVSGDGGGAASSIGFSNVSNTAANSTGVGTILMKGTTSRNSAGFIKIYIGTTAYYVPVFSAITG